LADKYIAKDQILNSDIVKDYINKNCKKDDKPPQQSAQIPEKPRPSPQIQNKENNNNSSLLGDDVQGYYAGDSLFAGV